MKKSLFALALTFTLVGAAVAQADDDAQFSLGDNSPNVNQKWDIDQRWDIDQSQRTDNSQRTDVDVDVDLSTNQRASGSGINTNLEDSTISGSNLVNGNQDNSTDNSVHQRAGLVAANGAFLGNAADNGATIFDGDIILPVNVPLGGGGAGQNLNTGLMTNSIQGEDNQQANYAGIAVNGATGLGASLNNTQVGNYYSSGNE